MSLAGWPAVTFHPSQDPAVIERELACALESGVIPAKFHYLSNRQAMRWLAVHEAFAPSASITTYDEAFEEIAAKLAGREVRLIGLGCGGGEKDAALAAILNRAGARVRYLACDASPALVMIAAGRVREQVPEARVDRLVADLVTAEDLGSAWRHDRHPGEVCLVACFGMMPNLDAALLLGRLAAWMDDGDRLLVNANLMIPGDGDHDIDAILPQYDNEPTRRWIAGLLEDQDCPCDPRALRYSVQRGDPARIEIRYAFEEDRVLHTSQGPMTLARGCELLMFFSTRFTPDSGAGLLTRAGFAIDSFRSQARGEEGLWLARKPGGDAL